MDTSDDKTNRNLPERRRPWLRTCLLGGLILVCGMVIGGGLTLYVATHRVLDAIQHPQKVPARMAGRMQKSLNLTDEQTGAVQTIIERHQKALLAIRDEVQPRVKVELNDMQREIEEVLTPEQAQRFRQRLESLRGRLLPPVDDGSIP